MADPVLIRFAIAVLAFILFSYVINMFVKDTKAKEIFIGVLLILCLLYALLGEFLPW
jgi:Kef-type K+ transport system membrane component KefB